MFPAWSKPVVVLRENGLQTVGKRVPLFGLLAGPPKPLGDDDWAKLSGLASISPSPKVQKKLKQLHEAAAGNSPVAIQARAGQADFSTTQRYIHLAGVVFRDEAERAQARIFGEVWVPEMGTDSSE